MDPTRRAMLNEFGLVQHAVFESADHNAVNFIYSHTQRHFVVTELTKELVKRTGPVSYTHLTLPTTFLV